MNPTISSSRPLSGVERRDRIAERLARDGRAGIEEMAGEFGVSIATLRRDVAELARDGRVQRVRGGARSRPTATATADLSELPALQREDEQRAEKLRIGAAAAATVQPGATIFLGTGTTVLAMARALRGISALTVITNSLLVVNALAENPAIELIALGGQLRRSEMSLIGHTAERALADLRADRVFMGIRAIDAHAGLTNEWLPETRTDRAILGIGREVALLADHSKFGRIAPAFVAPLSAVHHIITDPLTSHDQLDAARAAGVQVTVV